MTALVLHGDRCTFLARSKNFVHERYLPMNYQ